MNLPQEFITTIQNAFGENGRTWLAALPDLIHEASRQWSLTNVQPVPNLSYNFVAFALNGTRDVVLKIGVPNRELTNEINALRTFNGKGAVLTLSFGALAAMLPLLWALAFRRELVITYRAKRATDDYQPEPWR